MRNPLTTHSPGKSPAIPHDPVRTAMADALAEVAEWIRDGAFPLGRYEYASLQHTVNRGSAAESIAEVQRTAAWMGVTPEWVGHCYRADRQFGPVVVSAVYISPVGEIGGAL